MQKQVIKSTEHISQSVGGQPPEDGDRTCLEKSLVTHSMSFIQQPIVNDTTALLAQEKKTQGNSGVDPVRTAGATNSGHSNPIVDRATSTVDKYFYSIDSRFSSRELESWRDVSYCRSIAIFYQAPIVKFMSSIVS